MRNQSILQHITELAQKEQVSKHICILQERLNFALKDRERILKENPNLTEVERWSIDHELAIKKRDLDNAVEYFRIWRRDHSANLNQS